MKGYLQHYHMYIDRIQNSKIRYMHSAYLTVSLPRADFLPDIIIKGRNLVDSLSEHQNTGNASGDSFADC